MIVCLCRGLSDHAVRARMTAGGAESARSLIEACGAGTDCGSCAWMLESLLEGERGPQEYSDSITHRVARQESQHARS